MSAGTRAVDLDLAQRCASGDTHAIGVLQATYGGEVRRAMRRCRLGDADVEEAEAQLWTRLLVRRGGAPKIAGFGGAGSLRAWLRRCAAHEALTLLRRRRLTCEADPAAGGVTDPNFGPEERMLRDEHADVFRDAFAQALATLLPREREVLQLAVLESASSSDIARRYGVHRVTVARWLGTARSKLARRTRRHVRDRCGPSAAVAISQVELTLTSDR